MEIMALSNIFIASAYCAVVSLLSTSLPYKMSKEGKKQNETTGHNEMMYWMFAWCMPNPYQLFT